MVGGSKYVLDRQQKKVNLTLSKSLDDAMHDAYLDILPYLQCVGNIRENHPFWRERVPELWPNLYSYFHRCIEQQSRCAKNHFQERSTQEKRFDALDNMISVNKKRNHDYSYLVLDENSRSKRNVGPPKHFENMIMMEGTGRRWSWWSSMIMMEGTGRRKDRRDRGNDDGEDYAEEITRGRWMLRKVCLATMIT